MNILVLSRVSIPATGQTIPEWHSLVELGHTYTTADHLAESDNKPDAIVAMGVGVMDVTYEALHRWPTVPLYCYHWDCYSWVWDRPRIGEYDYRRYGHLLSHAREVWVPSACTARQTKQWWNLESHVILSSCPWWDRPTTDLGYALCTLRKVPDLWCDEFESACADIGIPFIRSDHALSYEDYKQTVANCRFIISHYEEASTGGLTLLEGYRLGKPCLLNDSELNGGRDYLQDRAFYFRSGDATNFRDVMQQMYYAPQPVAPDCREWVESTYNSRRMVESIMERMS